METRTVLRRLHFQLGIYALYYSQDGRHLVAGSADKAVRIYATDTYTCLLTMAVDDDDIKHGGITSVAVSPDGQFVAAGSLGRHVYLWRAETGELLHKLPGHADAVNAVTFSPNGNPPQQR